jgi:O-antigen ligase
MSLEDIPTLFSDYLEISLEAGQVLLSIIVILAIVLPTMYLSKGNRTAEIIMLFLAEALLVGIGWLPFWLLIATVAMMALAIAALGTKTVTGG